MKELYQSSVHFKYKKIKIGLQEKMVQIEEVPKEKYQKSRVEEDEVFRIERKLMVCMEKDKMFKN